MYESSPSEPTINPSLFFPFNTNSLTEIYSEVINAYNHNLFILAAVGIRAILEGICKEKGIVLVVAYSPIYRAKSSVSYSEVTNYCLKHNIPLIDYYADPSFVSSREWFADILHMNANGGKKYTAEIIAILRKVLNDSITHTS